MREEFTWGIVGTGRMAEQMAAAIGSADGHRVAAAVGRTRGSAAAFTAKLGEGVAASDSIEALAAEDVDLVYVASPNDRHADHIYEARAFGLPVLCEKPLASSSAKAREIHARLGDDARHVGVGFQYRQHPAHRRAREAIEQGELGELRLVEVTACLPALDVPAWYDDPVGSGGGILPMSGVHRVDIARWIVGREFLDVYATVAHHRHAAYDDTATIAGRFADGVGCTFQFGLDAPFGDDRIAIHGTEGSLILTQTMSQWWSDEAGSITIRRPDGVRVERFPGVDVYRLEVDDFRLFAAGEPSSIATVQDAVAVAEFTEAVYRSARESLPMAARS